MRIESDFSLLWHGFCTLVQEINLFRNACAGLERRDGMRERELHDTEKMNEPFCDFVTLLENRKNNITLTRVHLVLAGFFALQSMATDKSAPEAGISDGIG